MKINKEIANKIDHNRFGLSKIFANYKLGTELKKISDNSLTFVSGTLGISDFPTNGNAILRSPVKIKDYSYPLVIYKTVHAPIKIDSIQISPSDEYKLLISYTGTLMADDTYTFFVKS